MAAWLAFVIAVVPYACLTHRKGYLPDTMFHTIVYMALGTVLLCDRPPVSWRMFGLWVLVSVGAGFIVRALVRRVRTAN